MADRGRGRRRGQARWGFGSQFLSGLAAGTPQSAAIIAAGTLPSTVMRTRGEILVWMDGAPAAADAVVWAVGLIVMPEGQGTTVVSSPITDGNAPWFGFWTGTLAAEDTTLLQNGTQYARIPIDSKAMRILRPDREVQIVAEQSTIGGAQVININFAARFLFLDN